MSRRAAESQRYRDFRKLLDDKDVQAVVVSTPDHWHCLMAMMACAAGKDVYVEKPLSVFVRKGRWLARSRRSTGVWCRWERSNAAAGIIKRGREMIGKGQSEKSSPHGPAAYRNIMPGFGAPPDGAAPSDFDYDMWLGPAPKRPFNPHRGIYHFRWFWDYSGGQMTNLGAHSIDIVQWYLGVKGPSTGVLFRRTPSPPRQRRDAGCAGCDFRIRQRSQSAVFAPRGQRRIARRLCLEFFGTKGSLRSSARYEELLSDMRSDPANAIPQFKGHSAGGPQRVDKKPEPWTEALR